MNRLAAQGMRMGRPKKKPGMEGPPTATVRIDTLLARMAKLVAADRATDVSTYLEGITREAIQRDYAEFREDLREQVAEADRENPRWREDSAGALAKSPELAKQVDKILARGGFDTRTTPKEVAKFVYSRLLFAHEVLSNQIDADLAKIRTGRGEAERAQAEAPGDPVGNVTRTAFNAAYGERDAASARDLKDHVASGELSPGDGVAVISARVGEVAFIPSDYEAGNCYKCGEGVWASSEVLRVAARLKLDARPICDHCSVVPAEDAPGGSK